MSLFPKTLKGWLALAAWVALACAVAGDASFSFSLTRLRPTGPGDYGDFQVTLWIEFMGMHWGTEPPV